MVDKRHLNWALVSNSKALAKEPDVRVSGLVNHFIFLVVAS